jgi:uncharacterized phage infection (PIP) family protein YhgE
MNTSALRKAATKRRTRANAEMLVDLVSEFSEAKDAAQAVIEAFEEIEGVVEKLEAVKDALANLAALGLYAEPTIRWYDAKGNPRVDDIDTAIAALTQVLPTEFGEYESLVESYEEAEQSAEAAVEEMDTDSDAESRDEAYDNATGSADALCDVIDSLSTTTPPKEQPA